MARLAGERGRVTGTDIDEAALAAAESTARRAGVHVAFELEDASEPVADQGYDLAFSRLVLSHLVDPMAALRAMWSAVRPGGVVAVEDLLTGTLRSEPTSPVLDRLQAVYAATVRWHGGDPTIGPRVRSMLMASGLEDVSEATVVNPMPSVGEKLFIVELVENMRSAIRAAGVASDGEIDSLARDTEAAATDPSTVFYQTQMYQVCGRRPSTPRGADRVGGRRAPCRARVIVAKLSCRGLPK